MISYSLKLFQIHYIKWKIFTKWEKHYFTSVPKLMVYFVCMYVCYFEDHNLNINDNYIIWKFYISVSREVKT